MLDRLFAPLAVAILVSGLDDLVIDIAWAIAWLHARWAPRSPSVSAGTAATGFSAAAHWIAILLPLWQEHERDRADDRTQHRRHPLSDYHIFAGAYPNDALTQAAVRGVADRFPNVHLALCPHTGPTSKADCLNWIYQHLYCTKSRTTSVSTSW